ncbi:MAG TPA: COX15/CtaA family protein, partial [Rhizomicrobium sp.]|nr:COX15/CtaA family protein [Rhizomicrobium sp.]
AGEVARAQRSDGGGKRHVPPPPLSPLCVARGAAGRGISPASGGGKLLAAFALAGLVYVQMLLGAIVAGLHAGLIYNTWPSMNGHFLPEDAFVLHPWWRNFFENPGTAQFDHRLVAYIVAAGSLAFWLIVRRTRSGAAIRASSNVLMATVLFQIALGIATLLNEAPLALAALHQATAIVVFAAASWNAFEVANAQFASFIPAKAGTQQR